MALWLHEICGYNFFNIPDLTYFEMHSLINAKNRQIRKKNMENKRASRKSNKGRR